MSGFEMSGLLISGLSTTRLLSPPARIGRAGAEISATSTGTCACGSVDVMKTVRVTIDFAGIETSRESSGSGWPATAVCVNDALPPAGWPAIVIRYDFTAVVVFCANTTNPRGSDGSSGFALPGDPVTRPNVKRAE